MYVQVFSLKLIKLERHPRMGSLHGPGKLFGLVFSYLWIS